VFSNLFKKIKNRLASHKKLIAKYKAPETLFIYQMGKVGSTTLENSLPNVVHIHAFFSRNHTCPVRFYGQAKFGLKHFFYRAEQELLNYLLRRAFKKRKNTKIITLVREPLARNISMFFHDLDAYLFSAHTNCLNTRKVALPTRNQQASMLMDVFQNEFDHNYVFNWFDNELLVMTGIDIYQYPFDVEKGFGYANNHNIELLCLRTDKLKNCTDEITGFIGQTITLTSVNKAEDKWYDEIYQEFKQNYSPLKSWLEKANNSKLTKHFFG
jgi:putative capsular polysaccharide synthesis protein